MSIDFIGECHPKHWITGRYEQKALNIIFANVLDRHRDKTNLIINNTWLTGNKQWKDLLASGRTYDNVFYVGMIDPDWAHDPYPKQFIVDTFMPDKFFRIGNFDDSEYAFYIFAIVVDDMFQWYTIDSLRLTKIKHDFIAYNRKPTAHRVELVGAMYDMGLDRNGIVTLGGEKPLVVEHEVQASDNSHENDNLGIPNDTLSLGNIDYWKHHFLNIVSETESSQYTDTFVSEKLFKPMIGMRPFLVNGQPDHNDWLVRNDFKVFDGYFPTEGTGQEKILNTLRWLADLPEERKMNMYHRMYSDLLHNRARFKEFAQEQREKLQSILLDT